MGTRPLESQALGSSATGQGKRANKWIRTIDNFTRLDNTRGSGNGFSSIFCRFGDSFGGAVLALRLEISILFGLGSSSNFIPICVESFGRQFSHRRYQNQLVTEICFNGFRCRLLSFVLALCIVFLICAALESRLGIDRF